MEGVPLGADILSFDNNVQTTMTNNAAATNRFCIFFDAGATAARNIGGSTVNNFFDFGAAVPKIENLSSANHIINFPFSSSFSGGMEINAVSGNLTISNVISGGNRVMYWGAQTVFLGAANTYSGNTEINRGTLSVSGTLNASSSVFVGNGTVDFPATLEVNSNSTWNNPITINPSSAAGARTLRIADSRTPILAGTFAVNRVLGIEAGAGSNGSITGVISGNQNISKNGSGNFTIGGTAANTYTGTTTVTAGTLTLNKSAGVKALDNVVLNAGTTLSASAANQFGTGTPPLLTNNGTFNLNNHNQRVAIVGNGATNLGSGTLTIFNTGTDAYSGNITGTGGLIKDGTGIQTLSGTLSYTGTTTVTAGTLNLSSALSSATVVVNGTLTLQSGATLNVSSLTVNGTLNLQPGATLNVSAGGTMLVNGTMNFNGGVFALLPLAVPTATISYGASSELFYNAGGTVNPGQLWPLSNPADTVRVGGTTTLTFDVSGLSTRNLIINGGGVVNLGTHTLNILGAGTVVNNGTLNAGTSTIAFQGSATVSGGSTTFYNATSTAGLVNFGGAAGVSNEFRILSGGGTATNRPLYGSASTLVYQTGGNYFSNIEWEGTFGLGTQRPYNVLITGNTTLTFDNDFIFECRNNLTVDAGSAFVVDGTANDIGVFGNFLNNGTVTLSPTLGIDLFVRGNFTNNGTFNSNERAVFFDQGNVQTVNGNTTIDFVIVDKSGGTITLTAGATLNIAQGMTTTSNFNVAAGGSLRFLSNATRTAWLNNWEAAGNVIGTMVMERYMPGPAGIGYHFLSAPVAGATVGSSLSELSPSGSGQIVPLPSCDPDEIEATSPYGSVFRWQESAAGTIVPGCEQDGWFVVSGATPMTSGQGFAAYANGGSVIDIDGTATKGTISYTGLTNSGGDGDGWQMVGNPFPSPIDWNAPSGFEVGAHFFQTSGSYAGSFDVENSGTGFRIESMQGFQVRVPSGTHSFTLGDADRTEDPGTFYRMSSWYEQLLVLDVAGNGFMDKTKVYFSPSATEGFDAMNDDGRKRYSRSGQPTLYTLSDGEMTGINGRRPLAEGPRAIPLALKPGQSGSFTISVNTLDGFPATAVILLEDLETGAFHNLTTDPAYTFNMDATDVPERFVLHFIPGVELSTASANCEGINGSLEVTLPAAIGGFSWDNYRLVDSEGLVLDAGIPAGSSLNFNELQAGAYDLFLSSGSYEVEENLNIGRLLSASAGFEAASAEIYAGEEVLWINLSEGAAEYRYDFGDGTILSGVAEPTHTFAEAGEYSVMQEVWSADGCADMSVQSIEVMARVGSGLNGPDQAQLISWTQGLQVYVQLSDEQLGHVVRLSDVLGRSVSSQRCMQSPCMLEAPAAGAYILIHESARGLQTQTLILQQ